MFPISAADAISPAVRRTRDFLFRPFRPGTYVKLCLVALLTEGIGGNFSSHGGRASNRAPSLSSPFALTPESIAALVAVSLLLVLLVLFLYYLVTRLRFAYFHCLIHNTREIRPGWHLYRAQAVRFFWLNLVVGCCFLLLVALVALPFAAGFWGLFRNLAAGGHPDVGSILALVLPLVPIILLVVLAAFAVDVVLRDFVLPHYALENATAGQAWAAVWARIRAEKVPFFHYALLRVVLPLVALIALFIVLILPTIVFVALVAAIEVGIHAAFSGASGAAAGMGIILGVLVGVVAFAVAVLVWIGFGGPVSTAIREYALLFYGGRYQPLGNILSPPGPGMNAPGMA